MEVRDLFIDEETEERSIKYYHLEYDEDVCEKLDDINIEVEHCLYCRSALETIESKPYKAHEDDGEGVLTIKRCSNCESVYEVEDIYPLEEIFIYPEDYLTPYELRTVLVK